MGLSRKGFLILSWKILHEKVHLWLFKIIDTYQVDIYIESRCKNMMYHPDKGRLRMGLHLLKTIHINGLQPLQLIKDQPYEQQTHVKA